MRHFISVAALGLVAILPLRADPVPSLDQLTVLDQGNQITLVWHFYYRLLPQKFTLPDNGAQVDLGNAATLKDNLTLLARGAFALTMDGPAALPANRSELNLAADGGCTATLFYPGHKNGRVELRETILPLYPASYIINYEIYSPQARAHGISGYLTGGAPSPVIAYTQIGDDYRPSFFDALNATPVTLFKAGLRAAWIRPAWLFLTLIIVLLRPARDLYPLAWIMAVAWVLPILIWAADGVQIPFALHPILPALGTATIAALCVWKSPHFAIMAPSAALAGLLNGCFEIQQTTLERPPPNGANLTGLVLGLISGFALLFAVAVPLLHECRKTPGFQPAWAPKIAGALALGALVLAFIR